MKKGISMVSLIVTIVVMIILASITVFSSLNTMDRAEEVKKETEYREVCDLVNSIMIRYNREQIRLDLSEDTLVTNEQLINFNAEGEDNQLTLGNIDRILAVNSYVKSINTPRFGYHYVTGKQIQNDTIPGLEGMLTSNDSFTVPEKVENDYIINFYYGTVIAKISPNKTIVSGAIKGPTMPSG